MTIRRTTPFAGLLLAAVALATAAAAAGAGTAYRPQPSKVTVAGTSTLHDWTVTSERIEGEVSVPEGFLAGAADAPPSVRVSIPVRSLASGKKKMDELTHQALAAGEHPNIEYRLTGASVASGAGSDRVVLATRGRLTIAGTSREVPMEVTVAREAGGRLRARGTLSLAMTDFGVEPPTAMLGTVKTGDRVTISFDWLLAPERSGR